MCWHKGVFVSGHDFSRAKQTFLLVSFRVAPTERSEEGATRNLLFDFFRSPFIRAPRQPIERGFSP